MNYYRMCYLVCAFAIARVEDHYNNIGTPLYELLIFAAHKHNITNLKRGWMQS